MYREATNNDHSSCPLDEYYVCGYSSPDENIFIPNSDSVYQKNLGYIIICHLCAHDHQSVLAMYGRS